MSDIRLSERTGANATAYDLLRNRPPILVEVRFPNMAASPDWHLIEDEDEFDALLEGLGPNAELHLSSVWDLKNPNGPLRLVK